MQFFQFIFVGLAAGWIMGKVRRGRGYGLAGNLLVGAIGSLIGWFLAGFLMIKTPSLPAQLAMAVAGAVVFFLFVGAFRSNRKKSSKENDE